MYTLAMRDWLDVPPAPYSLVQFRFARVKGG
jgi:hypothetical protein